MSTFNETSIKQTEDEYLEKKLNYFHVHVGSRVLCLSFDFEGCPSSTPPHISSFLIC